MNIPNDAVMLLSYVNTQLRDFHKDLDDFCKSADINKDELCNKLKNIGYEYKQDQNQFK